MSSKANKYGKSTYEYCKLRKDCGRETLFHDVPGEMLDSILPNKGYQKEYALRNPVHKETQATLSQAQHECNTITVVMNNQSVNHLEGGWPSDISFENEEAVARYRRRALHDEAYANTVMKLAPTMTHYLAQNNAIEMYETYFSGIIRQTPVEKYKIQITNAFQDLHYRPVSNVRWTNEHRSKLAVSYCDKNFTLYPEAQKTTCYLWDIQKHTEPVDSIKPLHPCWTLACSPDHPEVLLAGLSNGTVNVFDIRTGKTPVAESSVFFSHREPVSSVLYITSRTHSKFFTGSSDGQCLWWDIRYLYEPTDIIPISIRIKPKETPSFKNSEPISILEFDRGLPTKFLCGTGTGLVVCVNRLGKNHSERMTAYWSAHKGEVKSVQRSPCTSRMFLTCGDYSVRVWSEEVRTAPIIVTKPYQYQVKDAAWCPTKYSSYVVVCDGGFLYYWDFLRKYKEPVTSLKVSKHGLTKVTPHCNGKMVVVGTNNGKAILVKFSDNMVIPGKSDKALMSKTYERETKREHILDTRMKEIRLKEKLEEEQNAAESNIISEEVDEEDDLTIAEETYFKIVQSQLDKMADV